MKISKTTIALATLAAVIAGCNGNRGNPPSALETIDPPVTVTTWARTLTGVSYKEGDAVDNNNWTRLYKKYGIHVKYAWTADASQFESKMNTSIAADDTPDIMTYLFAPEINRLMKGNMLADLTPYLEKLSPQAKAYLYGKDGKQLDGLDVDGKLYFLPMYTYEAVGAAKALYVRKDWLDKVGLPVPKTLDDFLKVADAFTNGDPDGNGKNDTYGVGLPGKDNLLYNWGGVDAFTSMWHANPIVWWDSSLFYEKDASGNLIFSGSKPQMKDALATLADMYEKGYLPKDFAVSDSTGKFMEDVTSGKVGMFFGTGVGMGYWFINHSKAKDPDAEWYETFIPSADGQPVKVYTYQPSNAFFAVSAHAKNPEVITKLIEIFVKQAMAKDTDKAVNDGFFGSDSNDQGSTGASAVVTLSSPQQNRDKYERIKEAVKANDTSELLASDIAIYYDVVKYNTTKSPAAWPNWFEYAGVPGTAGYHFYEEITPDLIQANEFYKVGTNLMTSLAPQYKKMATEAITKIIYGQAPASDWDKVLSDWATIGGDDIIKEVEASK